MIKTKNRVFSTNLNKKGWFDVKKFISSIAQNAGAKRQLRKAPKAAATGIGVKNVQVLFQLTSTAIKVFSGLPMLTERLLGSWATRILSQADRPTTGLLPN